MYRMVRRHPEGGFTVLLGEDGQVIPSASADSAQHDSLDELLLELLQHQDTDIIIHDECLEGLE